MRSKPPDIKFLFEPRSVAIIGASHNSDKIGYTVLNNLVSGGFKGKIYPVNPNGGEILGIKVFKSLEDIEGEIDLACIVIPAKFVFDAVQSCAKKKVKFIPIISSGFSEIGNIEEEKKIAEFAEENGMRILGPNIFGIYSASSCLNATFGPKGILPGKVAIVTQSGALGLSMIGKTALENMGLSAIVSVGNKSDIDEADLLDYLVSQSQTSIILMYIEGVQKGQKLIEALKRATRKKPVIVIKSGRSERGARAAASHTGSLAGSDEIFDGVMRQCGVLRAESVKEAFNWCKFLANSPLPSGENTLIITNGGGIGVMATDACDKYKIRLYDDAANLAKTFVGVTPDFGSTKNPVDLTGQATSSSYNSALEAALKSKDIDSVISLYCETAVFDAENLGEMIEQNFRKYRAKEKPVIFSIFGGEKTENCLNSLRKNTVSVFTDVYDAVSCFGAMYSHYRNISIPPEEPEETEMEAKLGQIRAIAEKALGEGRAFLLSQESQKVAEIMGITIPKSKLAHSLEEAVNFSEEIGYPVVMKIVSRDILHKSDVGGIALSLDDKEEVMDAYQIIMHNVREHKPDAVIQGVEISEMVERGTELIVGARRDRAFGPIIMFGLGGIYVEVMKDVAFRALPLGRGEITRMMKETRAYPLLLGARGQEKRDIDAVVDAVIKVGTIMRKCDFISDIEINPLVAYEQGDGAKAVDIRIMLSKKEGEPNG